MMVPMQNGLQAPLCARAVHVRTCWGTWRRPSGLWAPQSLTSQVLVQTLVCRVAVTGVLAAMAVLGGGLGVGAGSAIPGTVGIPGQAALSTSTAVGLTLVQPYLSHCHTGAHVEHLLGEQHQGGDVGNPHGLGTRGPSQDTPGQASHGFKGLVTTAGHLPSSQPRGQAVSVLTRLTEISIWVMGTGICRGGEWTSD